MLIPVIKKMNKRSCANCLSTSAVYIDYIMIIGIIAFLSLCICLAAYLFPIKSATQTYMKQTNVTSDFPVFMRAPIPVTESPLSQVTFSKIQTPPASVAFAPIQPDPDLTRVTIPHKETTIQLTDVNTPIPEKTISALEFKQALLGKRKGMHSHVKQIYPRTIHVDPYIKPSRKFDDHHQSHDYRSKNSKLSSKNNVHHSDHLHDDDDMFDWVDSYL